MPKNDSFQARRQALFGALPENSLAILTAASVQYRNSDVERPYRQDSYFYYLTGFQEAHAALFLIKKDGKEKFLLFCQEKDPKAEQWSGERVGPISAVTLYGADEAFAISDLMPRLSDLLNGITQIFWAIGTQPSFDKKLFSIIEKKRRTSRSGIEFPQQFHDIRLLLNEMRLLKSDQEIKYMREACQISVEAHLLAMGQCKEGMREYELEAILLQEFYRRGSRYPAYSSIVASGNQACTLHYVKNDEQMHANELVLIDAGAEYQYYAADITRTFPVGRKFSASQQAIYELVLASQQAAIDLVAPGVTWDKIQNTILQVIVSGLVDLKILQGDVNTLISEKAYLPFYMHGSGHWLGMDVHDVGDYKVEGAWRELQPGMVFTIEPGIYIANHLTDVKENWRGIGVRIEDDILITAHGREVMTEGLPKTVEDIHQIRARR